MKIKKNTKMSMGGKMKAAMKKYAVGGVNPPNAEDFIMGKGLEFLASELRSRNVGGFSPGVGDEVRRAYQQIKESDPKMARAIAQSAFQRAIERTPSGDAYDAGFTATVPGYRTTQNKPRSSEVIK